MKITPKAMTALTRLNDEGWQCQITRQMIDSLSAKRLIDFEVDRDGWHLTPAGQAVLKAVTA